jgi:hypothetical protein
LIPIGNIMTIISSVICSSTNNSIIVGIDGTISAAITAAVVTAVTTTAANVVTATAGEAKET